MCRLTLFAARRTIPVRPGWYRGEETAAQLEAMFAAGAGYVEMALALSTSPDSIYRKAKELGLIDKYAQARVGGPGRPAAVLRPKPPAEGEWPKRKRCLKCRGDFDSAGRHQHLCDPCWAVNRHQSEEW